MSLRRSARRVTPRPLGPYQNTRGTVRIPVRDAKKDRIVWARVSVADYRLAMQRSWALDKYGYPRCTIYRDGELKAEIYLHRLICRAPAGMQVDHVRHDVLDCRRSQLRPATPSQNTANRRRPRLGHAPSSRYLGVTLHRQTGKWQAAIHYGGRCLYLGLFIQEEDAARVRDAKARELFGSFAATNSLSREEAQAA